MKEKEQVIEQKNQIIRTAVHLFSSQGIPTQEIAQRFDITEQEVILLLNREAPTD